MLRFPPWATTIRKYLPILAVGGLVYTVVLVWYGFSPKTTDVGYAPVQPIPFNHARHAGQLGLDCRYCHQSVERAATASVPTTETCLNCHKRIKVNSPKLVPLHESAASGKSVEWVKIHDLPDFVYFNHSAHVTRGIGCVSCHGRIDTMERVQQVNTLSMSWCLDCHRNPEKHLRPLDKITSMDWSAPEGQDILGAKLKSMYHIDPPQDCSTCHR